MGQRGIFLGVLDVGKSLVWTSENFPKSLFIFFLGLLGGLGVLLPLDLFQGGREGL